MKGVGQKRDWGLIFNTDNTRLRIWREKSRRTEMNKQSQAYI